jgi:hypothetical protein
MIAVPPARVSEVGRGRLAAMLSADNVIDLMRKGGVILVEQATLAAELRPPHDFAT